MKNVNLVTTIKMICYKTDGTGRVVLQCPLMDARVVHNTTCIKEIDAVMYYNVLLSQEERTTLARRRQELVNTNIALYRSAGW